MTAITRWSARSCGATSRPPRRMTPTAAALPRNLRRRRGRRGRVPGREPGDGARPDGDRVRLCHPVEPPAAEPGPFRGEMGPPVRPIVLRARVRPDLPERREGPGGEAGRRPGGAVGLVPVPRAHRAVVRRGVAPEADGAELRPSWRSCWPPACLDCDRRHSPGAGRAIPRCSCRAHSSCRRRRRSWPGWRACSRSGSGLAGALPLRWMLAWGAAVLFAVPMSGTLPALLGKGPAADPDSPRIALAWPPTVPLWADPDDKAFASRDAAWSIIRDGVPVASKAAGWAILTEWGPWFLGGLVLALRDPRRRVIAGLVLVGLVLACGLRLDHWIKADLDRFLFPGTCAGFLLVAGWIELFEKARARGRVTRPGFVALASFVIVPTMIGPVGFAVRYIRPLGDGDELAVARRVLGPGAGLAPGRPRGGRPARPCPDRRPIGARLDPGRVRGQGPARPGLLDRDRPGRSARRLPGRAPSTSTGLVVPAQGRSPRFGPRTEGQASGLCPGLELRTGVTRALGAWSARGRRPCRKPGRSRRPSRPGTASRRRGCPETCRRPPGS